MERAAKRQCKKDERQTKALLAKTNDWRAHVFDPSRKFDVLSIYKYVLCLYQYVLDMYINVLGFTSEPCVTLFTGVLSDANITQYSWYM